MTFIDTFPDFSAWINKPVQCHDRLVHQQANLMAATINSSHRYQAGDTLPLAWHWLYFHDAINTQELAEDGHEKLGRFIPPVPLEHRMWAGGRLQFIKPLVVDTVAQKQSQVTKVTPKIGRSGPLCFVEVEHQVWQHQQQAVREIQTIVYRQSISNSRPVKAVKSNTEKSDIRWHIKPNALMLFRYSALTFNSHLIHYDSYYCQQHGYPHLIVHGPLNATLLLYVFEQHLQQNNSSQKLCEFTYQAKAPLFLPHEINVHIKLNTGEGDSLHNQAYGWIQDEQGNLITESWFVYD